MRFLAEFVMRDRMRAVLVALLFTAIPLFGWVADAIVALVTLRKGTREGALVLIWVILPGTVLGLMGYPQVLFYGVLGGTVTTYLGRCSVKALRIWAILLQVGAIVGIIAVVLVHILVPDIAQSWSKGFALYIQSMKSQPNFPVQAKIFKRVRIF